MKPSEVLKQKRRLEEQLYKLIEKGRQYEEENGRLRFENSTLKTTIEDLKAKIAVLERRLNER